MNMLTHTQMQGVPPEEQARRAILVMLKRVRNDQHVGYYVGPGSQTYDLLTEAYAALSGDTVENVRNTFCGQHPPPDTYEQIGFIRNDKFVEALPENVLPAFYKAVFQKVEVPF